MNQEPAISVLIVSFNTRDLLRKCLESLASASGDVPQEIIIVDNASRDGSADMVEAEFPEVQLIRSRVNLGFAAANNLAYRQARGRYIVLLNTDAFLKPGTMRRAIEHMEERPKAGLGGARLFRGDGGWQASARMFPSPLNDLLILSGLSAKYPKSRFFGRPDRTWADPLEAAEVDWAPGAFLIIRRETLERVGFFDENFFLYYEEVDLCRRIKAAGYEIWYWPDLEVIHIGGESSKTVEHLQMSKTGLQLTLWRMRSALLYYRKYHGATGAWAARIAETAWHVVRAWKNAGSADESRRAKAAESRLIIDTMKQAWRETSGGRVSPARPW
ncbi:MAG: glycosyltransferase family 2 protein [Acidobacteria bacterium]|nr:glycosyltransferase family 2 protein [Acidobacteriota bacterium]MCW5969229.1 glycosyltransferase family 2 protein [Blastocatellales bacterium]